MIDEVIEGIPVLIRERDRPPRTIRIKIKKKIKDRTMEELPEKHRQALQNYMKQGMKNKKKAVVDAGFSENHASRTMNNLLQRKPIINALKEAGATDEFIAEKLVEGVDAKHPQFKGKDYHASIKFIQEINKVGDNYPPTKIHQESKNIHIILTAEDHKQFKKFKEMRGEGD